MLLHKYWFHIFFFIWWCFYFKDFLCIIVTLQSLLSFKIYELISKIILGEAFDLEQEMLLAIIALSNTSHCFGFHSFLYSLFFFFFFYKLCCRYRNCLNTLDRLPVSHTLYLHFCLNLFPILTLQSERYFIKDLCDRPEQITEQFGIKRKIIQYCYFSLFYKENMKTVAFVCSEPVLVTTMLSHLLLQLHLT